MNLVKRWFMETAEGEVIDGPYKNEKEFDREFALYIKRYKYTPLKVERMLDADEFTPLENYDSGGLQTGRGRHGKSRASRVG